MSFVFKHKREFVAFLLAIALAAFLASNGFPISYRGASIARAELRDREGNSLQNFFQGLPKRNEFDLKVIAKAEQTAKSFAACSGNARSRNLWSRILTLLDPRSVFAQGPPCSSLNTVNCNGTQWVTGSIGCPAPGCSGTFPSTTNDPDS